MDEANEQIQNRNRYEGARSLILETGRMLPSVQKRRLNLKTVSKGSTDFATQADLDTERRLVATIKHYFPEDFILAEESAPTTYDEYASMEGLWVIDPLDGTTNFSLGEENYAISIAFVRKGVPIFGHIYQPARDLLMSGTGKSVRVSRGDERDYIPKVSPETNPNKCTIGHNWSYSIEDKNIMLGQIERIIPGNFRALVARCCAAGDLLAVADGRLHAYVQQGLKPWDVAAAGLLVQLAGGTVTGIDGTPWHPFRKDGDILASNGHLHPLLLRLLNG